MYTPTDAEFTSGQQAQDRANLEALRRIVRRQGKRIKKLEARIARIERLAGIESPTRVKVPRPEPDEIDPWGGPLYGTEPHAPACDQKIRARMSGVGCDCRARWGLRVTY